MKSAATLPDRLTPQQAFDYLSIGRTLGWQLIRNHQLPIIRLTPRCVRIPREELLAWEAARRVASPTDARRVSRLVNTEKRGGPRT